MAETYSMVDWELARIKGMCRRDDDAVGIQDAQEGFDESDFGHLGWLVFDGGMDGCWTVL